VLKVPLNTNQAKQSVSMLVMATPELTGEMHVFRSFSWSLLHVHCLLLQ